MYPRFSHTRFVGCMIAAATVAFAAAGPADAAAIRSGFTTNAGSLGKIDDGSASASLGFSLTFGGTSYSSVFVNNNGNITFDSAFAGFSPANPLSGMSQPIIAPFFADVDTRGSASNPVTFGQGAVDGRAAFAATWNGVGYYMQMDNKLNAFQVVLIDRSDTGAGNFDIEFNYDAIEWEVGMFDDATPPPDDGLGDPSARAGYADGAGAFFELDGSGLAGAFLAGGAFDLVANSLNSSEAGRYLFEVRGGVLNPVDDGDPSPVGPDGDVPTKPIRGQTQAVPEPATFGLLGSGLVLVLAAMRRRRIAG